MTDQEFPHDALPDGARVDRERRRMLGLGAAAIATSLAPNVGCTQVPAQVAAPTVGASPDIAPSDRVFITNEGSNTISVIDPAKNAVDTTINLTSFDEDPRPPFRFVT